MKKLLLSIFIFTLFYSCSEDSVTTNTFNESDFHNDYMKIWKLTQIEVSGMKFTDEFYTDEYFIFDKLGGGMVVYGEHDLNPEDTVTYDDFDYEIIENGKKIKLMYLEFGNKSEEQQNFNIVKLSENELIFEYLSDFTNSGNLLPTRITLNSIVSTDQGADERNHNLTNSNIKIWKFADVEIETRDEPLPCRADDYYLFATNGMGIKIFGDTHCVPGDTTNCDVFKWNFSEDSTEIIRTELHPKWAHGNSYMILSDTMHLVHLSQNEFKYKVFNTIDGKKIQAIITYVNYLR